jgi:hypothetical protein
MANSSSSVRTSIKIFSVFSKRSKKNTDVTGSMLTGECVHGIHLTPVGLAFIITSQMGAKPPPLSQWTSGDVVSCWTGGSDRVIDMKGRQG